MMRSQLRDGQLSSTCQAQGGTATGRVFSSAGSSMCGSAAGWSSSISRCRLAAVGGVVLWLRSRGAVDSAMLSSWESMTQHWLVRHDSFEPLVAVVAFSVRVVHTQTQGETGTRVRVWRRRRRRRQRMPVSQRLTSASMILGVDQPLAVCRHVLPLPSPLQN